MASADWTRRAAAALLASTVLASPATAAAQDTGAGEPAGTEAKTQVDSDSQDIIVTAQRRAENLQDVPIAITAITTKTLDDNQVDSFDDYAKIVPSLSYKSAGPGFANVYFRGVASGENANHSASLPSVGTYLDEQPITTITGALDLHVFDLARVEALAGPQGTLYGASSQAGTIRLITNKPDLSSAYGQVNLEVNKVAHGDFGYTGEGFVNLPVASNMAARVVGWYRRDGGYIDNVEGTRTYPIMKFDDEGNLVDLPGDDITISSLAEDNYNDVDTYGARAALRIDLDDSWTVTPQIMGQRQKSDGSFAEESGLGPLETMQFRPERNDDKWWQASLTVEGKLANFDVTYAGSYMKRQIDGEFDYSDYSYFYDVLAGYAVYWYDNDFNQIEPTQYIVSDDSFTKQSHELRFTSPPDRPIRLVGGLFYQRQTHNIEQNYIIDNLSDDLAVDGTDDNIWLTKQLRVDRDYAVFGEATYDLTPQVSLTGGGRLYRFKNSLVGFFGFNSFEDDGVGYSGNDQYNCDLFGPPTVGGPCNNVDKTTKDNGFVHRLNATYKPNGDLLFYATWSKGFRPGGVNRRGTLPPYKPDFLVNYETGAKISFGNGAHFNLAGYREDWNDIQLSFLGLNGLTEIRNAGNARIWGVEADLLLRPLPGLSWSTGVAFNDAKMRNDFCLIANEDFDCAVPVGENELLARKGTRLPLTAKWKANSRARYEWDLSGMRAHVQGSVSYEGNRRRDLRDFEQSIYGNMKAYSLVDAAAGVERGPWNVDLYVKNIFDVRGQITKSIQCVEAVCGDPDGLTPGGGKIYTAVTRPRTIGLRVGRRF
ncbi:TonB-dependent receptor [Sphingomonas sp.]|uniref:TonB-dependent receptor n=1 Tax=Sphingomonas sp. TaxID=28214 RepID=UPI0017CC8601|nr:TonB-dependent receptor [Sphingomonas sp.]MBA3511020.1 TonB-dependent receptor [Sphingomonas sp.]